MPKSHRCIAAVSMADPAAVAARAAVAESLNGTERREYGGKRQRTDDGPSPATSTLPAPTAPHAPSTSETSVNTIAEFIESLADYEPTVRLHRSAKRRVGCERVAAQRADSMACRTPACLPALCGVSFPTRWCRPYSAPPAATSTTRACQPTRHALDSQPRHCSHMLTASFVRLPRSAPSHCVCASGCVSSLCPRSASSSTWPRTRSR